MELFKLIEEMKHEHVSYFYDEATKLKAIVAIHSTVLGPAIGGTRFYNYESEDEALIDVLRLSQGMTYKNAAANIKAGGGKCVIIGDPNKLKSPEFFKAYASFLNRLSQTYYTAEDVNTSEEDMALINEHSEMVIGLPHISNNPSPFTSYGVFMGIKAAVKAKFNKDSVKGLTFSISGLGNVGYGVAKYLFDDGALLNVSDINQEKTLQAQNELNANIIGIEDFKYSECDVLVPCALGKVFYQEDVSKIKASIIAGAANNVLVDDNVGQMLHDNNILYIPDFIINAGGVINASMELEENGYNKKESLERVSGIYDTVLNIINESNVNNIAPNKIANEYAMNIIKRARETL